MAFKTHDITRYNYSFSSSGGGIGTMQLWNDTREVVRINFVDDDATLPPPSIGGDLDTAVVVFRRSALPALVDMLRNEKPVKATINNQSPGFVFVHIGPEPVGEGEA